MWGAISKFGGRLYNSINPINIVYRKPQGANRGGAGAQIDAEQKQGGQSYGEGITKTPDALEQRQNDQRGGQQFPNGARVAIDYSKSKINISQILTDFRSTILAINAPKEIGDEVGSYLTLVEKESLKPQPSRDIIVSNLKNASRVSDDYIAKSLGKPSKVVEGWVDALFLQNIVLKSDPNHVNPDFKVSFPERVEASQVPIAAVASAAPVETTVAGAPFVEAVPAVTQISVPEPVAEVSMAPVAQAPLATPGITTEALQQDLSPNTLAQKEFMEVFSIGKQLAQANNPKDALVAFEDALDAAKTTGNVDFVGATHLERGKIFDRYDYINIALSEYNEATKCNDDNIKTHAHLKMAKIYDDYVKFEPALEHYHYAVSYSISNPAGQTRALKGIGTLYTERFDKNNATTFNSLAAEVAQSTENPKIIGRTYREIAKDYEYLGENKKALVCLRQSTAAFATFEGGKVQGETNAQLAKNYFEAADVMEKLGNSAKASKLLVKARQFESLANYENRFESPEFARQQIA